MPDGSFSYGRAGNLHVDPEGNVMDPNGHPLEPAIRIPRNVTDVVVNEEGRVFVHTPSSSQPQEVGQIMLARFQNYSGLRDIGQNLYKDTDASGPPEVALPGKDGIGAVKQRALEFSNVNIVDELMNMLLTQRAFELITKTINSADAMLKIASDISK
jgi:flagellar basal-body rod protein FlgG